MSTSIDTSSLAGMAGMTNAGRASSATDESKDRFLSLLVAQMRNQDPLNPLDNAQVTTQLAQLSTVQGIESMNKTLTALAESLGADQLAQAASLIGHEVLVPGSAVNLADGKSAFGIDLDDPADSVKLSLFDAAGRLVSTVDAGALPAGEHLFDWDGVNDAGVAMPAGAYRFEVSALGGGKAVAAETLSIGSVNGVSRGEGGIELNVQGLGKTAYAGVRQII